MALRCATHVGPFLPGRGFGRLNDAKICPQTDALYPDRHRTLWESLGNDFSQDAFTLRAVEWLGGAVRVPTESYDKMGPVGVDERWEAFKPFHDYLLRSFPLTHEALTLTKVNTYGLLYEWKGSDDGLKPLLLAAHQDVVPVEPKTVDQWKYPPYSGHYDGESIWGRGSTDDKSGLIGIFSSVETLLEKDFKPTRTIVLAFGFDEEGAQSLSQALLKTYGEDSLRSLWTRAVIGFSEVGGSVIAIPGIAEKGYLDTLVTVSTTGGHSSLPPPHTSIGILSRLLVEFEDNPIKPQLERGTPMYSTVQCVGQHAKEFPAHLRALIERSIHSDRALRKLETEVIKNQAYKSMIGTTQAIDLIQGGVKANALPEEAWAVVNHRIATQSSISALTLTDAWGTALEPAPVTPTDGSAPWQLLSGTIKATYNAHRDLEGADNIIVGHYWKLTPHIVRYSHQGGVDTSTLHSVNEHIGANDFVEMIRFFTTLILNVDESTTF
ncbi:carboxypeptidase S [Lactarius quietus]|nr:carboxypeptidase S [Lactarius quietus]